MRSFPRLVLGTRNRKKRYELMDVLATHRIEVQTLDEYPQSLEVEETGQTFADNSRLKAVAQANAVGQWVLAEDSGLIVDVLGGAPGVKSARFAGANATDAQNNSRLLDALANVPEHQRTARYVCHLALSDPVGQVRAECEAECHGRIRLRASGTSGFGYDPLFEIREYHRTFAELGEHVKSMISHRGRALRAIVRQLLVHLERGCGDRHGL
jgi:XTP/dITP diphosphohydrolase